MDNIFTGINKGGYSTLMLLQYHVNFWLLGNSFIDIKWINTGSAITFNNLIPFKCPNNEIHTTTRVENNTFEGNNEPTFLVLNLAYLSDGY